MQIDALKPPGAVWWPDRSTVENANLTRFMRALGVESFEALNARANADPAWFHDELIRFLDYQFQRPYDQVLDLSQGQPFAQWCVGGTTNVVLNCVDRQRGTARYTQPAMVWGGEDGTVSTWTFEDLDRETCRLSWGLRSLGLGRGDVVGMYLPNLLHAAAAMLAVAKIGGIVLPMFSGFGADAITQRLNDGQAKALITVDGSLRRGKAVGAKAVADEALQHCPGVRHVVVLSHLATEHGWEEGRDHWWHTLAAGAPDDFTRVQTEEMPADDPFLLMFTSGTTGKPKGVVHTHCGFPVKTALDLSIGTGADVVDAEGQSVGQGVTGELVMRTPKALASRVDSGKTVNATFKAIGRVCPTCGCMATLPAATQTTCGTCMAARTTRSRLRANARAPQKSRRY